MITPEQLYAAMADGTTSRNAMYPDRKPCEPDQTLYRWKSADAHVVGHPNRKRVLSFDGSDFQNNLPTDLWVCLPSGNGSARINLRTGVDEFPTPHARRFGGHRLNNIELDRPK